MLKQLYLYFLDEAIPLVRLGLRAFVIAACVVVGAAAGCRMTRSADQEDGKLSLNMLAQNKEEPK